MIADLLLVAGGALGGGLLTWSWVKGGREFDDVMARHYEEMTRRRHPSAFEPEDPHNPDGWADR